MTRRTSKCKSCQADIIWAISEASGKRIPLDAEMLEDESGNIRLVDREEKYPLAMVVPRGEGNFVPHFATCPNADQHRRRG